MIVVNVHVARSWEAPNNRTLSNVSAKFPNVRLLDWRAESAGHPEWLSPDGLHLGPAGATAYVRLIRSAAQG